MVFDVRLLESEEFHFLDSDLDVALNVGGQVFETTVDVLTRDPYSVLAACCRIHSPIPKDEKSGLFYFDRDWWLFRHILAFLRSNVLPNELETLKELYTEASFYRLESLMKAIENFPLNEIVNYNQFIANTGAATDMEDGHSGNHDQRFATR